MTDYELESLHQLPNLQALSLPMCSPKPLHLPVSLTSLTLHSMEVPCDSKEIEQVKIQYPLQHCMTPTPPPRPPRDSLPMFRVRLQCVKLETERFQK